MLAATEGFPIMILPFGKYRKIPKISPGAYIFQRPFLRGLVLEGLKFAFQNRLRIYWEGNVRVSQNSLG